tara:strand:+ start:23777 stop:24673 length:897 start_codon:yes stop_codon:yes gene_type:complete
MDFDPKKIISMIVTQRSMIIQLLSDHERGSVFTPRIMKLCRSGSEAGVVQLALMDDCLHAIESVLFSLNESRTFDPVALHRFLKPVARLYATKDRTLYSRFRELKQNECERFLETHYTDCGPFGGANRRTKWSGFQLAKNADDLRADCSGLESYRSMIVAVVVPLLDDSECIDDVIELGGLWYALQNEIVKPSSNESAASETESGGSVEMLSIKTVDFGNPSILFDIVPGPGCAPVVKVNSSHQVFQNGRTLELLLQAWAEMELNAWDRRRQLLGDIRSDWGRAARDMLADSARPISK